MILYVRIVSEKFSRVKKEWIWECPILLRKKFDKFMKIARDQNLKGRLIVGMYRLLVKIMRSHTYREGISEE